MTMVNSHPGTYILVLQLIQGCAIHVGALGSLNFQPGFYAYVGSAFGPGGLRARVAHHLSTIHKFQWHIDYLRQKADVVEVWFSCDPARREHEWAGVFTFMPGVSMPFAGFGASDCDCLTHLFHFMALLRVDDFFKRLVERYPGHGGVQRSIPE
jgi:Uri superfamily endonuclease